MKAFFTLFDHVICNRKVFNCDAVQYARFIARIHRRTTQKVLNDPDNHDGVITYLEPDILDCEVKWALGSMTMNKASGGDGIPGELF